MIDHEDALTWLPAHSGLGPTVAVLPDAEELGLELPQWRVWFRTAAYTTMAAARGPAVFCQTDRKHDGEWLDKAALLAEVASDAGRVTLWHKVVLRRDPGKVDIHRPGYSHLLAFGPARPGAPRPDVIHAGGYLWPNGIGIAAAAFVVDWLEEVAPDGPVVNPFCGLGTIGRAAHAVGRDYIGCDTDASRSAEAGAALAEGRLL